ncbi:hypothetical protein G4Y79_02060 [Phototrophicus methaneseepsis]|uniref:DUF2784 domain-containing protein n=1 Tax=Phototrophicus methaneseepsis TaxID=2710758 RepID=A0A7S8EA36_9CHLR|nr:hypothetical protein [Phototrophicus methaneseepsis]QPC83182.1 hypothetical protein G4Y79_02060 [Phototrophicus methaneseepsis]
MSRARVLFLIKSFHSVAFLLISACILYMLYAGLTGQLTPFLPVAIGIVVAEITVYTLNGFHCPLTALARRYGDVDGHDYIADIFLPTWFIPWVVPFCTSLVIIASIALAFTWWRLH